MPPFAVTVISRPHGPCGLFMASFTRIITVFLFVYGFELVLRFSGIFTVMEGEGKEFTVYFEDDNLLRVQVSRSHFPTVDPELISPLHTQPMDAASEMERPNSVNVQGSLNMGAKSTISDAEALGVGGRRKIATDKGKQHELQRLKDHRTMALRHVTRQMDKIKPLLADLNNYEFVSVEMEGLNNLLVKLQDTQDNYVDALEDEKVIVNANPWYDCSRLEKVAVALCLKCKRKLREKVKGRSPVLDHQNKGVSVTPLQVQNLTSPTYRKQKWRS